MARNLPDGNVDWMTERHRYARQMIDSAQQMEIEAGRMYDQSRETQDGTLSLLQKAEALEAESQHFRQAAKYLRGFMKSAP
jgi:hypothetical protein